MKKNIILAYIIVLFAFQLFGANIVAKLDEVFKVPYILMDEDYICIFDYKLSKFVTYARKNFHKIAEFRRKGEGPGDILNSINSMVSFYNGYLYISHFPRVTIFSIKGKLKNEIKGPNDAGSFIPLGTNFVGISFPQNESLLSEKSGITYCLFDSQLKILKHVLTVEFKRFVTRSKSKIRSLWVHDFINSLVYKEKLFIGNTVKGFYFAVFDMDGKQLYEINRKCQKRPITNEFKTFVIDRYRKAVGDQRWNDYKSRSEIIFPEYFPAYSNFTVADNKIYVFIYPDDPGKKMQEVYILNLKGELLKIKTIEVSYGFIGDGSRLSIYNGKRYYLYDNEETDKWEIRFDDIDD